MQSADLERPNGQQIRSIYKYHLEGSATESFKGLCEGRYDKVFVFCKKQKNRAENSRSIGKIFLWFGNALSFLKVALDSTENGL